MEDEEKCSLKALLPFVLPPRRAAFTAYVNGIVRENLGDLDGTFIGFMDDYLNYAKLLKRKADVHDAGPPWSRKPPPIVVYDVGCAWAFQHVLFDPRIHYVGIDITDTKPQFFRDHCTFVHGRFSDVVESLGIDADNSFGIANMSLAYMCREDLPVFDRVFRRKFVL